MSTSSFVEKIKRVSIPGAVIVDEFCETYGRSCCTSPDTISCGGSYPDFLFLTIEGIPPDEEGYVQSFTDDGGGAGTLDVLSSMRNQSYRMRKIDSWGDASDSGAVYILADSEVVGDSDIVYSTAVIDRDPGYAPGTFTPDGITHYESIRQNTTSSSPWSQLLHYNGTDYPTSGIQANHPPYYSPLRRQMQVSVGTGASSVYPPIAVKTNEASPILTSLSNDFVTTAIGGDIGNSWVVYEPFLYPGTSYQRQPRVYGGVYLSRTQDKFSVPCELTCLRYSVDDLYSMWGSGSCTSMYGGTLENLTDHPSPGANTTTCDSGTWLYSDYGYAGVNDSGVPLGNIFWSESGGTSIGCGPQTCCGSTNSYGEALGRTPYEFEQTELWFGGDGSIMPQGVSGSTSWSGSSTSSLGGVTTTIDNSGSVALSCTGPEVKVTVWKQCFLRVRCVDGVPDYLVHFLTELAVKVRGGKSVNATMTSILSDSSVGFISSQTNSDVRSMTTDRHRLYPYTNLVQFYDGADITESAEGFPYASLNQSPSPIIVTVSP